MTTSTDSAKIIAEHLLDLLNRPDFVYTSEIYKILEQFPNDFDKRSDLQEEAVETARRKPLRRVYQFDYFCDKPILVSSGWTEELRTTWGIVRVQISSDVKRKDAIRGLKRILKDLESNELRAYPKIRS